jgi:hypothetical protein
MSIALPVLSSITLPQRLLALLTIWMTLVDTKLLLIRKAFFLAPCTAVAVTHPPHFFSNVSVLVFVTSLFKTGMKLSRYGWVVVGHFLTVWALGSKVGFNSLTLLSSTIPSRIPSAFTTSHWSSF